MILAWIIGAIILFFLIGIKQVNEYERGVKFSLGQYTAIMQPGWVIVIPIFQSWQKVDMRVKAVDVPDQDAMTKDNVSARVNAVIYYKVTDAKKAIIEVEHYNYAVSQLAQTTMRDVVGEVELDELLSKREEISNRIQQIVDKASDPWGIKISSVDLKHIELPDNMKRTMAKEAEAEREKRAVIIKADGDRQAAQNLALAAKKLNSVPGGMHLRTLQALNDISSDQSNTIVFATPIEVLEAFAGRVRKK
jgi:regulator of protease activity HflC (stomatin/prohibitin superfamily)